MSGSWMLLTYCRPTKYLFETFSFAKVNTIQSDRNAEQLQQVIWTVEVQLSWTLFRLASRIRSFSSAWCFQWWNCCSMWIVQPLSEINYSSPEGWNKWLVGLRFRIQLFKAEDLIIRSANLFVETGRRPSLVACCCPLLEINSFKHESSRTTVCMRRLN